MENVGIIMDIKRLKYKIEVIEKAYDMFSKNKDEAIDIADFMYSFRDKDYETPEEALDGYIRFNENNKSCENCKFIIRIGEHENDGCNGSHPIEIASADFCCNRWEQADV